MSLTPKFAKELENFFEWVSTNNYLIKDIDNEEHEWTIKLLFNYEEPARNKLELYIKSLLNKYTISIDDNDIGDAKLLAKEFKENKPKKITKKEKDETPKKITKKEKDETPKKITKKNEKSIIIDMSLDTSYTNELNIIEYSTSQLVNVFGKPITTGEKNDNHVYEWKIRINKSIYSIYDWYNQNNFENTTWYLAGTDENKDNIKILHEYIDLSIQEKHKDILEKNSNEDSDKHVTESDDDIILSDIE